MARGHGGPDAASNRDQGANVAVDMNTNKDPNAKLWHAYPSADEVLAELKTSIDGLSPDEAAQRLKKYGRNQLTPPYKPGFFRKLWDQINNVLIYILIAAAIVSGALKQWAELGLILAVVFINAFIGMLQEGKAEKAAEALKAMLSPRATAVRGGKRMGVDAEELVPGDIVFVQSGDRIPADLRLVQVTNLKVMEAMLTGESQPVAKNLEAAPERSPLGDRKCMAYSATMVMSGQALGVVAETGDGAEIGKINKMVGEVETFKTHLMVELEIFGRWISIAVVLVAAGAFFLAYFDAKEKVATAFESAVAIAVALIPEGLPAVVTITLALAVGNMAKQNAIVRQMPAVETLGSVTVICTDKTGTLTKNEMTVVAIRIASSLVKVTGVGYAPTGELQTQEGAPLAGGQLQTALAALHAGAMCNDGALTHKAATQGGREEWLPVGDPTEVALVTAAAKAGIDKHALLTSHPRIGTIPFESEHKFMGTVHEEEGRLMLFVKGAPDRIIPRCTHQLTDAGQLEPIDSRLWQSSASELSSQGLRCLALCSAELPRHTDVSHMEPSFVDGREPFLTMLGLAAILDPPREEAIEAIKVAHTAGIVVKMITGDHAQTATAIGRMLGIVDQHHGYVYEGVDLDQMSKEQLQSVVMPCNIYARASPENKIGIVRALQAKGQVCSMTGDGVNDAPALKAADIGVAMGITGTDVSKEAAKMVLADDNFATIVVAVKEGRRVWDNMRKLLAFNTPVNFAQGFAVFFAYALQFNESPLTAIQVLYVNLISAVAMGMMLANEPAEWDVMLRPPRPPRKHLFGKFVIWRTFFVTTVIVVLVLGMFEAGNKQGLSLKRRRAEAFNVLVFCEIGYALSCRFLRASSLHPRVLFGNPWVYIALGITAGLQVLITYTPGLNDFFSMRGIDGAQWGRVIGSMVATFLIVELEKALFDPVFIPLSKPLARFFGKITPKFLQRPSHNRAFEPDEHPGVGMDGKLVTIPSKKHSSELARHGSKTMSGRTVSGRAMSGRTMSGVPPGMLNKRGSAEMVGQEPRRDGPGYAPGAGIPGKKQHSPEIVGLDDRVAGRDDGRIGVGNDQVRGTQAGPNAV